MTRTTQNSVPALLLAANVTTIGTLVPIALHQLGALDHLPDPPSPIFASDEITESNSAHPLGIPDAMLGLGSFSLTLALSIAAHRDLACASTLRSSLQVIPPLRP